MESKFWRVVVIILLLLTCINLAVEVYELQRWGQRDVQFNENRRRIERLESLLLEKSRG